jgi:hypothetical protein
MLYQLSYPGRLPYASPAAAFVREDGRVIGGGRATVQRQQFSCAVALSARLTAGVLRHQVVERSGQAVGRAHSMVEEPRAAHHHSLCEEAARRYREKYRRLAPLDFMCRAPAKG